MYYVSAADINIIFITVPRVMVESNGTSIVVVSSGPRDARMVNRERANASDRFTKPPQREMNGEYVNLSQSEENEDDDEIIVVHEKEKSPRVSNMFLLVLCMGTARGAFVTFDFNLEPWTWSRVLIVAL